MPDIQLRFHQDVLVLSAPPARALQRIGIADGRDQQLALLLEPETVEDAYQLEVAAGPQALCALTQALSPIQLTKAGMEGEGEALANRALSIVRSFKPQHVMAPVSPCGLPLDPWSAASLKENRSQYVRVVKLLKQQEYDAILLDSFESLADLKCALMGVRTITDAPVIALVKVGADGMLADGRSRLAEACEVMADLQASVAGFATEAAPEEALALAREALEVCGLPLLVQLDVRQRDGAQMKPTAENPYYCPDTMVDAALALQAAGVQFLRAGGDATPAYTGALVAAVSNMSVARAVAEGEVAADGAEGEPPLEALLTGAVAAGQPTGGEDEVEASSRRSAGASGCPAEAGGQAGAPSASSHPAAQEDLLEQLMAQGKAAVQAALGKRTGASPDIVVEDDDATPQVEALCGEYACLVEPPAAPADPQSASAGEPLAPEAFVVAAVADGAARGVSLQPAEDVAPVEGATSAEDAAPSEDADSPYPEDEAGR